MSEAVAAKKVAILGAGPVGLAAAAHVLERGMEPIVLEAGPTVGHAVRQWSHVQIFSPWAYNIDKAAERLLIETGWNKPQPDHYPTGAELLEQYLEPLAARTRLKDHIRTKSVVTAVGRVGFDKVKTKGREAAPFEIRYQNGRGPESVRADAVIDATGTWFSPNPAGASGLPAFGERQVQEHIAYGMPDVLGRDRARYAGKVVAVLGAAADQLSARGALGTAFAALVASGKLKVETGFRVSHLGREDSRLRITSASGCCEHSVRVNELVVSTGFRPDFEFLRELRLSLDPALECPPTLAPLIDPNVHSCGTVRPHGAKELAQPEPGFYFAGMKSYGRAPTFLMMTGYEQVRSIAAEIAGDHESARKVELVLPETGVCSGPATAETKVSKSCCGPKPAAPASGCCAPGQQAV
jgi:hypothetical protein